MQIENTTSVEIVFFFQYLFNLYLHEKFNFFKLLVIFISSIVIILLLLLFEINLRRFFIKHKATIL